MSRAPLELGEYGICEACGRPIEIDRLEALPTARLCKEDARRADIEKPPKLVASVAGVAAR